MPIISVVNYAHVFLLKYRCGVYVCFVFVVVAAAVVAVVICALLL